MDNPSQVLLKFTEVKKKTTTTTFFRSIFLTFNITDSLITCSDGVCFWSVLVLGCIVEPSVVGVVESY